MHLENYLRLKPASVLLMIPSLPWSIVGIWQISSGKDLLFAFDVCWQNLIRSSKTLTARGWLRSASIVAGLLLTASRLSVRRGWTILPYSKRCNLRIGVGKASKKA